MTITVSSLWYKVSFSRSQTFPVLRSSGTSWASLILSVRVSTWVGKQAWRQKASLCQRKVFLMRSFSSPAVQKEPTQSPVQSHSSGHSPLLNRLSANHHWCPSPGWILWSHCEYSYRVFTAFHSTTNVFTEMFSLFQHTDRTVPVLIIGILVFLPGIYHLRIAYYASKGYHGYSYDDIPDFDDWRTPQSSCTHVYS